MKEGNNPFKLNLQLLSIAFMCEIWKKKNKKKSNGTQYFRIDGSGNSCVEWIYDPKDCNVNQTSYLAVTSCPNKKQLSTASCFLDRESKQVYRSQKTNVSLGESWQVAEILGPSFSLLETLLNKG